MVTVHVKEHSILLDDNDYKMLQKKFGEHLTLEIRKKYVTLRKQVNGVRSNIMVARLLLKIMNRPEKVPVYIDRNPLNLQRSNLKSISRENAMKGRASSSNSSSKYLGVYWSKNHNKWRACIKPSSTTKNKHLGLFQNEDEAAEAYNQAALKHHGKFANLNKIEAHV